MQQNSENDTQTVTPTVTAPQEQTSVAEPKPEKTYNLIFDQQETRFLTALMAKLFSATQDEDLKKGYIIVGRKVVKPESLYNDDELDLLKKAVEITIKAGNKVMAVSKDLAIRVRTQAVMKLYASIERKLNETRK